ncbi:unnamed protein product [Litomosoides sigmodontis]|uniref:Neurotransmitter-gated ion-channel ligand-binding domain-containing protein n=1 Tax=Litomosoides sigmodontis TaxID=42156 RepID=A0A3P6RUF5_LITSI|nr:unnamed protein product [Litomosoides sigmodontis]
MLLFLKFLYTTATFTTIDCMHRYNISDLSSNDFSDKLEDCIYYYLVGRARAKYEDTRSLHMDEPTSKNGTFTIIISHVAVRRVELTQKLSSQFTIYGDLYLSWEDDRLKWDKKEWQLDGYTLHDTHHIWKPTIDNEHYLRYPEEENNCCLFFSIGNFNYNQQVNFKVQSESKTTLLQTVKIAKASNELTNPTEEHSSWMLEHSTVAVAKISGSNFGFLHICVRARKQMSTLRIALRLPISVTTILMLASPLFGHLTAQIYIKLFAFLLQTISFIFLCSIAPENDTFFEMVIVLTVISTAVNMIAIALSRIRRTIPPRHNFYLASKVINRLVCCIEPDPTANYFRHSDTCAERNLENAQPDYTTEWRHIYIAFNNIFSTFALVAFIIVALFEML